MSVKKYIRKNSYRWHRVTSLIVALPILLWSLSGFLHPVMNSLKPDVRNQFLPATAIDTAKIHIPLQQALQKNRIAVLHNFRIIQFNSSYYYQIQQLNNDTLIYLSCADGVLLKNGDRLYASYLAQRYLSEPFTKEKQQASHGHRMNMNFGYLTMASGAPNSFHKTKITKVVMLLVIDVPHKK